MRTFYLRSAREIKRLEAISRSPVYSFFSSTMDGLSNLRYLENHCLSSFMKVQDRNTEAYLSYLSTSSWLNFYVSVLSAVFLSLTAFVAVISRASAESYLVGLSVIYALTLSGSFQWAISQSAETEIYSETPVHLNPCLFSLSHFFFSFFFSFFFFFSPRKQ